MNYNDMCLSLGASKYNICTQEKKSPSGDVIGHSRGSDKHFIFHSWRFSETRPEVDITTLPETNSKRPWK